MEILTIVTLLAILQFISFGAFVGMARGKYGVAAPATTGNQFFERQYRIHYNTMEQLIVFVPGLWAFGHFINFNWAAGIGLIYLIGRVVYAIAYAKDPAARGTGMIMTVLPSYVLVLGGLGGAIFAFFSG